MRVLDHVAFYYHNCLWAILRHVLVSKACPRLKFFCIALDHVDLTGNPDAACMYLTSASTLGRLYVLSADLLVLLISGFCFVRGSLLGRRAKRNSFGIHFSLNPMRMGLPSGNNTVTSCFVNKTVRSASQMGPTPTRVLVKDGMMYPVFGKSAATCGIGSEAIVDNLSTCPVTMPKQIFGVLLSGGPCGDVEVI